MDKIVNLYDELAKILDIHQNDENRLIYFAADKIKTSEKQSASVQIEKYIPKDKFLSYLEQVRNVGGRYDKASRSFIFEKPFNGYSQKTIAQLFAGKSIDDIAKNSENDFGWIGNADNDKRFATQEMFMRNSLRNSGQPHCFLSDPSLPNSSEIGFHLNGKETEEVQSREGYEGFLLHDIEYKGKKIGYAVSYPDGRYLIRTNLLPKGDSEKLSALASPYNAIQIVKGESCALTYRDINLFIKDIEKILSFYDKYDGKAEMTTTPSSDLTKGIEVEKPNSTDIQLIQKNVQLSLNFDGATKIDVEHSNDIKNGNTDYNTRGEQNPTIDELDSPKSTERISSRAESIRDEREPNGKDADGVVGKEQPTDGGNSEQPSELFRKDEQRHHSFGERGGDSRSRGGHDSVPNGKTGEEHDGGIPQGGSSEGRSSVVLPGTTDSLQQNKGDDNSRRRGSDDGRIDRDGADLVRLRDRRRRRRGGRGGELDKALNKSAYLSKTSTYPHGKINALNNNIEVIELLASIVEENRNATIEEKEKLATYSGWGGLLGDLRYNLALEKRLNSALEKIAKAKQYLNPNFSKEAMMDSINASTLNAYFTPNEIIDSIHYFTKKAGFEGGRVLEPSMGTGRFFASMDSDIIQKCNLTGVEKDAITGLVSQILYPEANIKIKGFEDCPLPNNYDLVLSNIPFGDISVYDKEWNNPKSSVYKAAQSRIHNYFAVKMLERTAPGGLCVILASNAIMDTDGNSFIRQHISKEAEFLGAVRLPNNVFQNTKVVTDIIFLRKFNEGEVKHQKFDFISSSSINLPYGNMTTPVAINRYFKDNPSRILGKTELGWMHSRQCLTIATTDNIEAISSKIRDFSDEVLKDRIFEKVDPIGKEYDDLASRMQIITTANNDERDGSLVLKDGKLGFLSKRMDDNGDMEYILDVTDPALSKKSTLLRSYLEIKSVFSQIIKAEIEGDDSKAESLRKTLNDKYDNFTKRFGFLNGKENANILKKDVDFVKVKNLEKIADGKNIGKADIFFRSTIKRRLNLENISSPHSAVSTSLAEFGYVNTLFLEQQLGSDWEKQTENILFKIPNSQKYQLKDLYLSGDVKTKLSEAKKYLSQDASLQKNIDALTDVIPADIPAEEISIRLGNRWIPTTLYEEFFQDLLQTPSPNIRVAYAGGEIDSFNVSLPRYVKSHPIYHTSSKNTEEILNAAINDKTLFIKKKVNEKPILDREETCIANDKVREIRNKFQDWVIATPERAQRAKEIYNEKYNRTAIQRWDGSHLNFEGISLEPRPHQKDAVWMLMQKNGGIIDHMVGAGKTLVMESAVMEMKRIGTVKKPLLIGLKANVQQLAEEFIKFYPNANILAPSENDFSAKNRRNLLAKIAVNDYDCVILTHEQYAQLEHSTAIQREVAEEKINELQASIAFFYNNNSSIDEATKKQLKSLEKRKANLLAKINQLNQQKNVDEGFCFENLGFDFLMVDESHKFKNLQYATSFGRVAGLGNSTGSKRAFNLLLGVRSMQKLHGGDAGVVFASGTTITNSIVELYTLLQYLRPNEMKRLGFATFDSWASNFAEKSSEFEFSVTGEVKQRERFRKFLNVPELSKLYTEISDVRNDKNLKLDKPEARTHLVNITPDENMKVVNAEIINFAKTGKSNMFDIHLDENDSSKMLLATTLSSKAAIDLRLLSDEFDDIDCKSNKIGYATKNIAEIYSKFNGQKGTQMVFSNSIENHNTGFSVYAEIKRVLVEDYNIPADEIADIRNYDTDAKKKKLFEKMNNGEVRILMGSTDKLGIGVNAQERVVAIHHIDVPWTPAALEQRNGRGVRQGNKIAKEFNDNMCDIYFYATEQSLDAYKYQLLETKSAFINQVKTNSSETRECTEGSGDEEEGLSFAEIVAVLSGNPLLLEKSKIDKKVEELTRRKRAFLTDMNQKRGEISNLIDRKEKLIKLVEGNRIDQQKLEDYGFAKDPQGLFPINQTINGTPFDKAKEAGNYLVQLFQERKPISIEGFGYKATILLDTTNLSNRRDEMLIVNSDSKIAYKATFDITSDPVHLGQVFRSLLNSIYTNGEAYKKSLEEVNQKQEQLKDFDMNAIFKEEEALTNLMKRQSEITLDFERIDMSQETSENGLQNEVINDGISVAEENNDSYTKAFDFRERSREYNESHGLVFNGDVNNTEELEAFFNTNFAPKNGKDIGIFSEKYLSLLQEKNLAEGKPKGQFLIDPDLIRDCLDCMGYDRSNVVKYKKYGGKLCDQIFNHAVGKVEKRPNARVLFLTGNPAAGKGNALKSGEISKKLNLNEVSIIFDSQMGDFDWFYQVANNLIEKDIHIDYVQIYNDYYTSFCNMIDRGFKEGRFVNYDYFQESFETHRNRAKDILNNLIDELITQKISYIGIDCSKNIVKNDILTLGKADKEFEYIIDSETLNKCYAYGEQRLKQHKNGITDEIMSEDEPSRLNEIQRQGYKSGTFERSYGNEFSRGTDDTRGVAEDRITSQLGYLLALMQRRLHNQQLQNNARTIENTIWGYEKRTQETNGHGPLGLSRTLHTFDFLARSREYNESHGLVFNGDVNNTEELEAFFNANFAPENGKDIGIFGEKYLSLLQEKNLAEGKPKGQFLIDPDLIRDCLDCMGYDRGNVEKYKQWGDMLCDQIFIHAVASTSLNKTPSILFLTGNPAAGKGHALSNNDIFAKLEMSRIGIIYDSPMSNLDQDMIENLLYKGFTIKYVQIYNDPLTSFKNMIERGIKTGRFLPADYFLKSYLKQENRASEIMNTFGSKIEYVGINNKGNIADGKLYNTYEAISEFIYTISQDTIKKFIDYGENRLREIGQGTLRQGVEKVDASRAVSKDRIASLTKRLSDIEFGMGLQLGVGQNNARTSEKPIHEDGQRGNGEIRNRSLGLSRTLHTFDFLARSREYNEAHGLVFNGDVNNTVELEAFFNANFAPENGKDIGMFGEKYLSLLQEKNLAEGKPRGQFLIDPDLIRDCLDCMGYDRSNVVKYKSFGDQVCDQVFIHAVSVVSQRQNPNIVFLTGSPASGKSYALKEKTISAELDLNSHAIIYDSPMGNFDWGKSMMKDLLNKGFKVDYIQVYNDFYTSYTNMIERGLNTGRFVDFEYFNSAFECQKNRTLEILLSFPKEIANGTFTYKGIDFSDNTLKNNILNIDEANGEFSYRILTETLKNCYIYGEQRLHQIHGGTHKNSYIQGTMDGTQSSNRQEGKGNGNTGIQSPNKKFNGERNNDTRESSSYESTAENRIASQLHKLQVLMQERLYDQQLRNNARTSENSIRYNALGGKGKNETIPLGMTISDVFGNNQLKPFDFRERSREYNEAHGLVFNGDVNNTVELEAFFNANFAPENGKDIGMFGEKYLSLLQEKNLAEGKPRGQFLIDPDLIRDCLDCMGYDRSNVVKYKSFGDQVCDQVFIHAVSVVSQRQNPNIIFLTGSHASGKSHALKDKTISAELDLNSHAIIYDSPMGNFDWGKSMMKDLLNKGFKVDYIQVYNDFYTSYTNMIERGIKTGRFVGFDYFIEAFENQKGRANKLSKEFGDELNNGQLTYKGIDCSENYVRGKSLELDSANEDFVYRTFTETLKNCYNYGEQQLEQIRKEDRLEKMGGRTPGGRTAISRAIAEDKIATQLGEISLLMRLRLHNQQLRNDAGAVEKPIQGDERRTPQADGIRKVRLEDIFVTPERKMDDGEFSLIERKFSEKGFSFTGEETISSPAEVAYLFRELENSSVENAFAVYHKKEGGVIVQHLAIGSTDLTVVPISSIIQGAKCTDAKAVSFVHNHPSGRIEPSQQDRDILRKLEKALDDTSIKVNNGIIINTISGKFSVFSSDGKNYKEEARKEEATNEIAYDVYAFDKLAFSPEYKPQELSAIRNSAEVAEFLSSHRLGERDKLGYLILDRGMRVVANLFLSETNITTANVNKIANEMSNNAIRFGGSCVVAYGRFHYDKKCCLNEKVKKTSGDSISVVDIICQEKDNVLSYSSCANNGTLSESASFFQNNKFETFKVTSDLVEKVNPAIPYIPLTIREVDGKKEIALSCFAMKGVIDPSATKDVFLPRTALSDSNDTTLIIGGTNFYNDKGMELGEVFNINTERRIQERDENYKNFRVGEFCIKDSQFIVKIDPDKVANLEANKNGCQSFSILRDNDGNVSVYPSRKMYANTMSAVFNVHIQKDKIAEANGKPFVIAKNTMVYLGSELVGNAYKKPSFCNNQKQNIKADVKQEQEVKAKAKNLKGLKL